MIFPVGNGTKQDFEANWKIDTSFGNPESYGFHEGADINLKTGGDLDLGQPIRMIADGRVVYYHFASHPTNGFGRHLVYKINGPWGSRWIHCAHCIDTEFTGTVKDLPEGAVVARIGKSGTTLAHLHFSVFKVDPATLPGGIDNIANNLDELNTLWENPINFINQWMTAPCPELVITDQTKIPQIVDDQGNPMEVQAIRSQLNDLRDQNTIKSQKLASIHSISS